MLNPPSSGRLRTISSRSDCRTEDETDGQRSTWLVLRMPPLLSFFVLWLVELRNTGISLFTPFVVLRISIARVVAKLITKAYTFIAKMAPWVIFTALSQRLIKLLIQYLEDALVSLCKKELSNLYLRSKTQLCPRFFVPPGKTANATVSSAGNQRLGRATLQIKAKCSKFRASK